MVERFLVQIRHVRAALQETAEVVDELERDLMVRVPLKEFSSDLNEVVDWEGLVEVLRKLVVKYGN